ncbi:MAG: hypothetical protein H0T89_01900 [Deltaproteobacteria bacterium]|nr:hypothetical protein [Deltaproteobacteria bacterium]MDQ3299783.1 hypothetical protein [Myxococcota bacterium]
MTRAPTAPPAGYGDPTCPHVTRTDGVCERCGHCAHDVILNAACLYCGTTDLDPIAMSPKQPPAVIPADALVRKKS